MSIPTYSTEYIHLNEHNMPYLSLALLRLKGNDVCFVAL